MRQCIGCGKVISGNKLMCLMCNRGSDVINSVSEKSLTRVESLWLNYRVSVISPEASDAQLIECKRAFYGGAHSFFMEILGFLTPGSEAQESDLVNLSLMEAELRRFNDKVKAGLA